MTAPDPQVTRRNRRFLLVFLAFFVVAGIGTTIYGFQVVERVKLQAARSDHALRLRAWSILAEADATGRFPSEASQTDPRLEQLRLEGGLAELTGSSSPADFGLSGEAWPDTREKALEGLEPGAPVPDTEAIREIVQVSWDPEGRLPPVLSVSGRPSGLVEGGTTLELVNRWLRRAADQLGR